MEQQEVCRLSFDEAGARGEAGAFRSSHKLNAACKEAVEAAIRDNYDGMRLNKACLGPVVKEYGYERLEWVLANTVRHMPYDGRISRSNREWAEGFAVPGRCSSGRDFGVEFIVMSHPGLVDLFINIERRERAAEKESPGKTEEESPGKAEKGRGKTERKPSIMGQLWETGAQDAPAREPSGKSRDGGAR